MNATIQTLWNPIKRALLFIGKVQSLILMGITYCIFIGPIALLYQFFHHTPRKQKGYWIKREQPDDMGVYLRHQF